MYRSFWRQYFGLILGLFIFSCIRIHGQNAVNGSMGSLIMDLESHIQWAAVQDAWKTARESWITSLKKGDTELSKSLLQLEFNLKPTAMETAWSQRRQGWRTSCASAANASEQLPLLLLELESNLKWEAVDEGWKTRRDGWIADLAMLGTKTANAISNDPNCSALAGIIKEINTNGFKKWVANKELSYLWGTPSVIKSDSLLFKHYLRFELASQNGYQQKILDDTWIKVKHSADQCLAGWRTGKTPANTDMVNGDNIWWEKDGLTLNLYFSINAADYNDTHYLVLTINKRL